MTAPAEPLALERRQRRVAKRGFRLRRYGGRLLALALSALAVLILVAVIDGTGPLDLPAHLLNRSTEPLGFVAGGVIAAWLGAWVVLAGVWLLGVILRGAGVLSAVARVTLDEALRTRVVTFAAGLLIVILAALPLMLTGDQPLRYQLQSYLAYSVFRRHRPAERPRLPLRLLHGRVGPGGAAGARAVHEAGSPAGRTCWASGPGSRCSRSCSLPRPG